jgi:hypothetical protein
MTRLRAPVGKGVYRKRTQVQQISKVCQSLISHTPFATVQVKKYERMLTFLSATAIKTLLPQSSVLTPPPHGIRRKEGLDVWKLGLGERYFPHYRDSWPLVPGLAFEVYTERLEDQLAAEAKAASPLYFDQDDKENDVANTGLGASSDFLDAMSESPASPFRRSDEDHYAAHHGPLAAHAFMNDNLAFSADPYGLGGTDGARDRQDDVISETMRLLASGEKLPRISTPSDRERADGKDTASQMILSISSDSVIGRSFSSAIKDGDSVCGSERRHSHSPQLAMTSVTLAGHCLHQ